MQASYHCTLNELLIHDVCRNIQDRSIFHRSRLPTVDYEHHIRSNSTRSETQEIVTIFVSERYKITFLVICFSILLTLLPSCGFISFRTRLVRGLAMSTSLNLRPPLSIYVYLWGRGGSRDFVYYFRRY